MVFSSSSFIFFARNEVFVVLVAVYFLGLHVNIGWICCSFNCSMSSSLATSVLSLPLLNLSLTSVLYVLVFLFIHFMRSFIIAKNSSAFDSRCFTCCHLFLPLRHDWILILNSYSISHLICFCYPNSFIQCNGFSLFTFIFNLITLTSRLWSVGMFCSKISLSR